jgi:HNH endonuclease
MIDRICAVCGNAFSVYPSALKRTAGKYCSRVCMWRGLPDEADRFWRRVDRLGPAPPRLPELGACWLWRGPTYRGGYGQFSPRRGGAIVAHKWAYQELVGRVPKGLLLCHRCDVPACVRPEHLFLGTAADNARDAVRKGRVASGTRNAAAKLDESAVRAIRRDGGASTVSALARRFRISRSTIRRILDGQAWRDQP